MRNCFHFVGEQQLSDGSLRLKLDIDPSLFVTVGFILESLEGCCIYTTVFEEKKQFLQVDIPPDYITTTKQLMDAIESYLDS